MSEAFGASLPVLDSTTVMITAQLGGTEGTCMMQATASNGKRYYMPRLPLDMIPGYLPD